MAVSNLSAANSDLDAARAALAALDRRHGRFYDALTDQFEGQVQEQVVKAVAALVDELRAKLELDTAGNIKSTIENLAILRRLDVLFEDLMARYGYSTTVKQFIAAFPEQLPLLRQQLDIISNFGYHGQPLKKGPLVHRPLLAGPDLATLVTQQRIASGNLISLVATVGDLAKRKALMSLGSVSPRKLADMLSTSLQRTVGECRTLAATSMAMFYRTANARALDKIAADSGTTLYYKYAGPEDVLNRPFCANMLRQNDAGKAWTRAEIDQLNNGQFPVGTCFVTNGGYACRHQWRLALPDELPTSARRQQAETVEAHKVVLGKIAEKARRS